MLEDFVSLVMIFSIIIYVAASIFIPVKKKPLEKFATLWAASTSASIFAALTYTFNGFFFLLIVSFFGFMLMLTNFYWLMICIKEPEKLNQMLRL
jgi:hypothetical protein